MFQKNDAYQDTFAKQSDQPPRELTEAERREVENWSDRFNYERTLRIIGIFVITALLTGFVVYQILFNGLLDSWL